MKSRCLRRLKRAISWGFEVTLPGLLPQEMPLVAAEDVARGGMISRAFDGLGYLLFGD